MRRVSSRLRRLERDARLIPCIYCSAHCGSEEGDKQFRCRENEECARIWADIVQRANKAAPPGPCPNCGRARQRADKAEVLTHATDEELQRMVELKRIVVKSWLERFDPAKLNPADEMDRRILQEVERFRADEDRESKSEES